MSFDISFSWQCLYMHKQKANGRDSIPLNNFHCHKKSVNFTFVLQQYWIKNAFSKPGAKCMNLLAKMKDTCFWNNSSYMNGKKIFCQEQQQQKKIQILVGNEELFHFVFVFACVYVCVFVCLISLASARCFATRLFENWNWKWIHPSSVIFLFASSMCWTTNMSMKIVIFKLETPKILPQFPSNSFSNYYANIFKLSILYVLI